MHDSFVTILSAPHTIVAAACAGLERPIHSFVLSQNISAITAQSQPN